MGEVSSWVIIDTNDQELFPSQSKNFNLTINVPAGTCDCDFTMWLDFDAYDKDGQNHSFQYDPQGIIIDNSPLMPQHLPSAKQVQLFLSIHGSVGIVVQVLIPRGIPKQEEMV